MSPINRGVGQIMCYDDIIDKIKQFRKLNDYVELFFLENITSENNI